MVTHARHSRVLARPACAQWGRRGWWGLRRWVPWLVALLAFAACGGPVVTPTRESAASATPPAAATPSPSPSPTHAASPTRSATPRSGRVPPPTPDPAAVVAGAPLRATLLAQIGEYERAACAGTATVRPSGSPAVVCRVNLQRGVVSSAQFPELVAYVAWLQWVEQSVYSERSPTGYVFGAAVIYPTLDELRAPWRLDVYVSGAEWCGRRGPGTTTR
jgi:hypothetical protein